MNADKLVPCLETCRKLREAGIEFNNSFMVWTVGYGGSTLVDRYELAVRPIYDSASDISAPTLAELLEWLPNMDFGACCQITPGYKKPYVVSGNAFHGSQATESLAESAAQLALWVKQNGYKEGSK